MLHIIHKNNKRWYKGRPITSINMSTKALTIQKLQTTNTTTHINKKSRKQRKHEKEVNSLQERNSILPATTFKRIVIQEGKEHSTEPLRWNADAIQALQSATENELTTVFTGSAFCAGIAKRDTITIQDMRNFQALRQLN